MTATTNKLTLYDIETELLELLELRDEVAAEVRVTESDKKDQVWQLHVIDQQIAEYVKRECVKVDSIAGLLRECKARTEAAKKEEERLRARRKLREEQERRLKECISDTLAMTLDPQVIAAASQNQVLKRLNGQNSELKLCKSPASVQVTDETLVPSDMKRVTASMSREAWDLLIGPHLTNRELLAQITDSTEIDKRAIAAALKQGDPVPGARLIEDSVHVRIS